MFPGQTTPRPHNMPNNAAKKPSNPKSAQHHGAQHPFFKGGSAVNEDALY